jgi:hypothetical protein
MSNPLLVLVAPMDDIKLEREEEEWDIILKYKGYHEQQSIMRYVA